MVVGVDGGGFEDRYRPRRLERGRSPQCLSQPRPIRRVGLVEGLRRLGELVRQVAPSGAGSPDGAVADVGVATLAGPTFPPTWSLEAVWMRHG